MRNFKPQKILLVIITFAIAYPATLGVPSPALAIGEPVPPAPLFCVGLNAVANRVQSSVDTASSKLNVSLYDPARLAQLQAALTTELAQKRAIWDRERQAQYESMLGQTKDDTQRTAVESFKSSIESAISVRRIGVDAAIATYFTSSGADLQNESNLLSKARDDFKTSVATTISQAKSDCAAGKSSSEIRANFQSGLKSAQADLQTSRQSATVLEQGLAGARKAELSSIDKALKTFTSSAADARQSLIDALKKDHASKEDFGL